MALHRATSICARTVAPNVPPMEAHLLDILQQTRPLHRMLIGHGMSRRERSRETIVT
jgi:hypothetical protein